MTQLRAHVYRDILSGRWIITIDEPWNYSNRLPTTWTGCAYSWPEAMQYAHKMLYDLDRQFMDRVHESRSRRRVAVKP